MGTKLLKSNILTLIWCAVFLWYVAHYISGVSRIWYAWGCWHGCPNFPPATSGKDSDLPGFTEGQHTALSHTGILQSSFSICKVDIWFTFTLRYLSLCVRWRLWRKLNFYMQELIKNKAKSGQSCCLLEDAFSMMSCLPWRSDNLHQVSLIENYPAPLTTLGEPVRQVTKDDWRVHCEIAQFLTQLVKLLRTEADFFVSFELNLIISIVKKTYYIILTSSRFFPSGSLHSVGRNPRS